MLDCIVLGEPRGSDWLEAIGHIYENVHRNYIYPHVYVPMYVHILRI